MKKKQTKIYICIIIKKTKQNKNTKHKTKLLIKKILTSNLTLHIIVELLFLFCFILFLTNQIKNFNFSTIYYYANKKHSYFYNILV